MRAQSEKDSQFAEWQRQSESEREGESESERDVERAKGARSVQFISRGFLYNRQTETEHLPLLHFTLCNSLTPSALLPSAPPPHF